MAAFYLVIVRRTSSTLSSADLRLRQAVCAWLYPGEPELPVLSHAPVPGVRRGAAVNVIEPLGEGSRD